MNFKSLTKAEQVEYYNWLLSNADRLEELRDQKNAKFDELWKIAESKKKKIQKDLEYFEKLRKKVAEKKAERQVVTEMLTRVNNVSQTIQKDLNELNPQVDHMNTFCRTIDEKTTDMKKLLKNRKKRALKKIRKANKKQIEKLKEELNEVQAQSDQREQAFNAVKEKFDESCQALENLNEQKDELIKELTELNPEEIYARKCHLTAVLDDYQEIYDGMQEAINSAKLDLDDMIEENMNLAHINNEYKLLTPKAIAENRAKEKEVENEEDVLNTLFNMKLEDDHKKYHNQNLLAAIELRRLDREEVELMNDEYDVDNSISDEEQKFEKLKIQKIITEKRIIMINGEVKDLLMERKNISNMNKEIDAKQAEIEKYEAEWPDIRAQYLDEAQTLTHEEQIVMFEEVFDFDDSIVLGTLRESSSDDYDASADSSSCSENVLSNTTTLLKDVDVDEVIGRLDPVKSCSNESLYKKS